MDPIQIQKATSKSHQPWIYDVFLSFRGEDTRKTFVSHLDKALVTRGIFTFKDSRKVEVGDSLSEELCSAIRKSTCAVVVMSENYATSSWCLEELRLIMELVGKNKIKVLPIFYGAKPSDVRHQRENFALERHHQGSKMAEKVLGWTEALTGIANCKGMESIQFEDDATMIEDIVQIISTRLLTMSPIDFGDIFGMEAHMERLSPLMDMDSKDDARIIGISGMGGIGKTTIAKYLYEKLKLSFSPHYHFMENVSRLSKEHGLLYLQHQMLSYIFHEKNLKLECIEHGRQQLEYRLRNVKVFLVLDNVDDVNQLYALAKEIKWFGPGSRIIITTRDKSLLNSCGVKIVYNVKCLDDDKALQLFKWIAFEGGPPPYRRYKVLSNHVFRLAQGLPLALKALGASLCGKLLEEWEDALESFERVPNIIVSKILQISCASLDEPGKTAFLNIAYLFNGDPLWRVTTLIERGEDGVKVLAEKSLIDISADGRIDMHELVKQNSRDIPTQRRILRHPDEIYSLLGYKKGTTEIEGVVLGESVMRHDFLIEWKHFERMHNLNFLMINQRYKGLDSRRHLNLEGNVLLPRNLRLLHWEAYPYTTLPSILSANCLVEVNLCSSKLRTLWSGTPRLLHLRKLNLTGSKDLEKLPDLQEASSLEELMLEGCISLKRLPESIRSLYRLQKLDVSNCDGLKNLRIIIRESNVTVIQGRSLPVKSACMDFLVAKRSVKESQGISHPNLSIKGNLIIEMNVLGGYAEHLCVTSEQQILEQQTDKLISPPYGFKSLDIMRFTCDKESGSFECRSFSGFRWLTELYLINLNIKTIPDDVHHMLVLEKLDLSGNDFRVLPSSMIHLLKLKHLTLCNCRMLEKLPELYQLETLTLSGCTNLRALVNHSHANQDQARYNLLELSLDNCKNVESLSDELSHFTKLTYIDISRHDFETVPRSIKDLSSLITLCLDYCKELKSVTELPLSLKYLYAHGCNTLEASSFQMDHSLDHLDLSHCFHWHQDYTQITRFPYGKRSKEVQVCVCIQKSKRLAAYNQGTRSLRSTPTKRLNIKTLMKLLALAVAIAIFTGLFFCYRRWQQ